MCDIYLEKEDEHTALNYAIRTANKTHAKNVINTAKEMLQKLFWWIHFLQILLGFSEEIFSYLIRSLLTRNMEKLQYNLLSEFIQTEQLY